MHWHVGTGEIKMVSVVFHHEPEGAEHVPSLVAIVKCDNLLNLVAVEFHVARAECLGYLVHGHFERLDNGGYQVVFRVIPDPDAILHLCVYRCEGHGGHHGKHGNVRVEV